MRNFWKITGWYLFAVGIIHNVVGAFIMSEILLDILTTGLKGHIHTNTEYVAIYWMLFVGFFFIYIGLHWQEQIRRYKEPLSKFTAWGLTVITVVELIIEPISGFWLLVPLCFSMLYPHYFIKTK